MNRTIFWDQNQSRTFDYVEGDRDILYALAYAMQDLLGSTSTVVSGFTATAESPASLSFTLGAGRIYQLADADATAIGAIPQDTTQIFQQGAVASQTITLTAPATAGQSQWNLVEAQFSQVDSIRPSDPNGGLLYFYNSANPSQPFQGPGNDGQTTDTLRAGTVVVQVVQGTAATTGSEVPPNPTSGWVPLYLVDLSNGQTQITQGEILAAGPSVGTNVPSNYPAIPTFELLRLAQIQNGSITATFAPATTGLEAAALGQGFCNQTASISANYTLAATDGGKNFVVTNGPTVTLSPTIPANQTVGFEAVGANFTLTCSSGAFGGSGLDGSTSVVVPTKGWVFVQFDGTNWRVISGSPNLLAVHGMQVFTTSGTFTVPNGVTSVQYDLMGDGGGGGGSVSGAAGSGGTGGARSRGMLAVTSGAAITVTIGPGGAHGTSTANGNPGTGSAFGTISAPGGVGGLAGTTAGTAAAAVAGASVATGGTYNLGSSAGNSAADIGGTYVGGGGGPPGGEGGFTSITNGTPVAAPAPGWGGGGGANGSDGASGAPGLLVLTW